MFCSRARTIDNFVHGCCRAHQIRLQCIATCWTISRGHSSCALSVMLFASFRSARHVEPFEQLQVHVCMCICMCRCMCIGMWK